MDGFTPVDFKSKRTNVSVEGNWVSRNRDRRNKYQREWRNQNKDKEKQYNKNYREKKERLLNMKDVKE